MFSSSGSTRLRPRPERVGDFEDAVVAELDSDPLVMAGSAQAALHTRQRLLAWLFDRNQPGREVSALLALTDDAVEAVRNIVSSSDELPETGGLRLVAERSGTQANLQLSVVALPAEEDEVIEEQGVRVFLEPEAAALLDDKVLDASMVQNQVEFTIADQVEE